MAFIVQGYSDDDLTHVSLTIERRTDALETAFQMVERGNAGVRIIGDGRIYNLAKFSVTIAAKELTENAVQRFIVSHHSRYQDS